MSAEFLTNKRLTDKQIKKLIGFFAPLSFGVYLIHVNPLVWVHFMKGRFAEIASLPLWLMIGAILLTAICLYLACSLIDALRHYLFKLLRIKEVIYAVEKRLVKNLWENS